VCSKGGSQEQALKGERLCASSFLFSCTLINNLSTPRRPGGSYLKPFEKLKDFMGSQAGSWLPILCTPGYGTRVINPPVDDWRSLFWLLRVV
jgi:hypothetical protein